MAGINIPTAQQVNQQAHALTTNAVPNAANHAITATEAFANNFNTNVGGLGYLFNHNLVDVVATPIEKATDSVQTNLGGFIRASRSYLMEHPLVTDGEHTAGTQTTPSVPSITDTVRQQLGRLRSYFGV